MRAYKNPKKTSCRYLKAEDIYSEISAAIFLLAGTDIYLVVTD